MSYENALRRQHPDIQIVHGIPQRLPRQSDSCSVHRGYIGCVGGPAGEFALFFTDLEPALAFVQAGRTSLEVTGVDLVQAVDVRRLDADGRREVRTIYTGPYLTGLRGCKALLARWVEGVRTWSAHWQSPDGRTLSEEELRQLEEDCRATAEAESAAHRGR